MEKRLWPALQRGLRVVRAKSIWSFSRSSDWSPEELVLTLNDSPDSMAEGTISGGDFSRDTCMLQRSCLSPMGTRL